MSMNSDAETISLPPCPKCGKVDYPSVAVIYETAYLEVFDETGAYLSAEQGVYSRRKSRNVVRCGACNKIRHDLCVTEDRIVEVKP